MYFVVYISPVFFCFWIFHISVLSHGWDGIHGQYRSLVMRMAWLYLLSSILVWGSVRVMALMASSCVGCCKCLVLCKSCRKHSMAAHRRSTGAYNTLVDNTVAGPAFMFTVWYNFIGYVLIGRHSLETLLKANQVLMAHFDLEFCIERLQTYTYAVCIPSYILFLM